MFKIDDDMTINVTRGDCGKIDVSATVDDAVYVFSPGDILRLKVFEKKNCENVVLKKDFGIEVNATTVTLTLTGKDTKFGEIINKPTNYWYEIELNPETNPQTIVGYDDDGPKLFCLHPEGNEVEETEPDETDVGAFDDKLDLTSNKALPNWLVAKEFLAIKGEIKKTGDNTVYVSSFGAKGDGVTDDREAIEQAIAALTDNSTLVFPKGHYVIKSFPIDFEGYYNATNRGKRSWFFNIANKKNVTIDLNDSIIELKIPSTHNGYGFPEYEIINLLNCENFIIANGTIIGDRLTHDYTKLDKNGAATSINHCWGHGVRIRVTDYNKDVCGGVIENLKISELIGDGISIYNGNATGSVTLKSCEIFNCRRHAVVMGNANNVTVDNCYLHDIGTPNKTDSIEGVNGTGCGIDVEVEALDTTRTGILNVLNTTIKDTSGYTIVYSGKSRSYVCEGINVENCKLTGTLCLDGYSDRENEIPTPIIVKNSIITHGKWYDTAKNKINGTYTHKPIYLVDAKVFGCIINSDDDENYYTVRSDGSNPNYTIIIADTLENCVINLLVPNAKLRGCTLINCTVRGGVIQSYESSGSSIKDCTNVLFSGCRFKVVSAKGLNKMVNCRFVNCVDDTSSGKGLSFRQCYFDTRFLPNGDYQNCVFEDEIEV